MLFLFLRLELTTVLPSQVDALEPEYLKEQARLKAKQSDKSNQPREVVQLEEFCQWSVSLYANFFDAL